MATKTLAGQQVGAYGATTTLYGGLILHDWTNTLRSVAPRTTPTKAPKANEVDPYHPDSCAVYRFFNSMGALLYVGIASDPRKRFKVHADGQAWWREWSARTVVWFPTREGAREEELIAIKEERPAFNVADAPPPFRPFSSEDRAEYVMRWSKAFDESGIGFWDLDRQFDIKVQLNSFGHLSGARLFMDPVAERQVYEMAYARAGRFAKFIHHRHVDYFNERALSLTANLRLRLTAEDDKEAQRLALIETPGPSGGVRVQKLEAKKMAIQYFEAWKAKYEAGEKVEY